MLRLPIYGCLTPLLLLVPHSARSQNAVTCLNCTDEVTTVANDVQIAAQWATQIADMENQIQQQITIWQQLSGTTNVNNLATTLNQAANFNAMSTFGNIPQMLQGTNFGSLGGLGQSYLTQNTYFMPTTGSSMPLLNEVTNLFNRRGGSLASVQSISTQLLTTSNTILTGLQQLQASIDGQPNVQNKVAINSRLTSYHGNIQSQAYQLAQVQAFARAQKQVFDEQEKQANFCSAYGYFNDRQSLSGGGLTLAGTGAGCTEAGGSVAPATGGGSVPPNGAGSVYASTFPTESTVGSGALATDGSLPGTDDTVLATLSDTEFGAAATANATALGVNPSALAATCVIESNCTNVAASAGSTIQGPFQVAGSTFTADYNQAIAANPSLASLSTGSNADPVAQSIAASQELKNDAVQLQAAGIDTPTVLDARSTYQFGSGYGAQIATAPDDATLSSIVTTLTPTQLAANGLTTSTTVGQWRASITAKLGASASVPVLLGNT